MSNDKKDLRRMIRQKMANLPEEYIESSDAAICDAVAAMPEFLAAPKIFAYFSVGREVSTRRIIELSFELGKTVALPISLENSVMEFALFEPDATAMETGSLNIPQPTLDTERVLPERGDLILVPALSYDKTLYRLGQGGGYYDKFLSTCPAFAVGLCRSELMMDAVPKEEHDQAVDCLVTEIGTFF